MIPSSGNLGNTVHKYRFIMLSIKSEPLAANSLLSIKFIVGCSIPTFFCLSSSEIIYERSVNACCSKSLLNSSPKRLPKAYNSVS